MVDDLSYFITNQQNRKLMAQIEWTRSRNGTPSRTGHPRPTTIRGDIRTCTKVDHVAKTPADELFLAHGRCVHSKGGAACRMADQSPAPPRKSSGGAFNRNRPKRGSKNFKLRVNNLQIIKMFYQILSCLII